MSALHGLYGLRLAANAALPGLPTRYDSGPINLRVRLKEEGAIPAALALATESSTIHSYDGVHEHVNLRTSALACGEYFGLLYGDGVRFAVDRHGREVWADWPKNYTLEDACTYLLGPVMGFVLRLRGTVCLHASSVAIGDNAIALVGLPGAGKSTTAAAFGCAGFPVLSDDIVALADKGAQFLVQPGYPRVNLWPDSVRRLFGSEDALPRITPTWEKRYMPLGQNGHRFASMPLPLGAVYILGSRDAALAAPVAEEVSGEEAFMALVANTYVNYLLDKDMRRTEFDILSRLVSEIPIRRVRPLADPSALFDLCDVIAADARRVMRGCIPANTALGPG